MSGTRFEFGDRVRHRQRPEWGVGSVARVEEVPPRDGAPAAQRLSVRFPNGGVKTLLTAHADLERVVAEPEGRREEAAEDHPVHAWSRHTGSDWLGEMAGRKVEEAMIALPEEVRDPFVAGPERLARSLKLFRFDGSARSLVDWAIAQSGLEDPLSRFSRHELEAFFGRWAQERDQHLGRLLAEDAAARSALPRLLEDVDPAIRRAVRRIDGRR